MAESDRPSQEMYFDPTTGKLIVVNKFNKQLIVILEGSVAFGLCVA
jgi:hypothetical protein